MPSITLDDGPVYVYKSWTTDELDNSAAGFPTGADTTWGMLNFDKEIMGDASEIILSVDVLKSSDNSVLIADKSWSQAGIDLTNAGTNDIKIKFKVNKLTATLKVFNVYVTYKYGGKYMAITKDGKNLLIHRLITASPTQTYLNKMALGSGTTAPTESDTALQTENYSSAFDVGYPAVDLNLCRATFRITLDTSTGNGNTYSEAAVRNEDGTPKLLFRSTFTPIAKDASSTLVCLANLRLT